MVLKQVAGRLLENDEGQGEDEADVQTRTQHTGVLKRVSVIKHASQNISYLSSGNASICRLSV